MLNHLNIVTSLNTPERSSPVLPLSKKYELFETECYKTHKGPSIKT